MKKNRISILIVLEKKYSKMNMSVKDVYNNIYNQLLLKYECTYIFKNEDENKRKINNIKSINISTK